MSRAGLLLLLVAVVSTYAPADLVNPNAGPCADCHFDAVRTYARSAMARAARTRGFLQEWEDKGRPQRCLRCHAPTEEAGVACVDCHGAKGHPYPAVDTTDTCAQCHDAPGEITLHSYRQSPAARQGKSCVDCHLRPGVSGHEFLGTATPGFLENLVRLGVALRRDEDRVSALVTLQHSAGHAIPGGTTGRSLWLLVDEMDREGHLRNRQTRRFGWYHSREQGWIDETLPPGRSSVSEFMLQSRVMWLRVRLLYRFEAGPLSTPDPRQLVLAEKTITMNR